MWLLIFLVCEYVKLCLDEDGECGNVRGAGYMVGSKTFKEIWFRSLSWSVSWLWIFSLLNFMTQLRHRYNAS